MIRWLALALALSLIPVAGCVSPTDPLGRQDALEDAQQRYTDLVRWGELEKAGMFVDPALRADYLRLATSFNALRITDFEIGDIVYGDDDANVTVVYKGYVTAQLVERTAREEQAWYREAGLSNVWRVRPQLASVLATLEGHPPESGGN